MTISTRLLKLIKNIYLYFVGSATPSPCNMQNIFGWHKVKIK